MLVSHSHCTNFTHQLQSQLSDMVQLKCTKRGRLNQFVQGWTKIFEDHYMIQSFSAKPERLWQSSATLKLSEDRVFLLQGRGWFIGGRLKFNCNNLAS